MRESSMRNHVHVPAHPYAMPAPARRRKRWPWVLAVTLFLMLACGFGAYAITAAVTSDSARPAAGFTTMPAQHGVAVPKTMPAPAKTGGVSHTVGDGTYEVGQDIAAGTYTTTVPADAIGCYWERDRNFSGELSAVIANDNLMSGARGRVTIKTSDKGVTFSGGCQWVKR